MLQDYAMSTSKWSACLYLALVSKRKCIAKAELQQDPTMQDSVGVPPSRLMRIIRFFAITFSSKQR